MSWLALNTRDLLEDEHGRESVEEWDAEITAQMADQRRDYAPDYRYCHDCDSRAYEGDYCDCGRTHN
jgi:hypothetical protein